GGGTPPEGEPEERGARLAQRYSAQPRPPQAPWKRTRSSSGAARRWYSAGGRAGRARGAFGAAVLRAATPAAGALEAHPKLVRRCPEVVLRRRASRKSEGRVWRSGTPRSHARRRRPGSAPEARPA